MKKQNIIFSVFIFLLFCCSFFVFPYSMNATKTYAEETTTNKINSQNCLTDYDMDSSLYKVLNRLAQHITNGDRGTIREFDIDVFNVSLHDSSYYNPSSTYGEAILKDLSNGILNLSTGNYADDTSPEYNNGYGCLKNSSNFSIKNINGLNSLNLTNIKTLVLDGNALTSITASDLSSLENLTTLSIAGNNLRSFTLSTDISNLNNLNLSNNQLIKIDLSRLSESNTGTGPIVNLCCNIIENIEDITFSNNIKLSKLDISFNKLNNLSEEDVKIINSHLSGDNIANILIQGTTDFSKLYAGDTITCYASQEIPNFNIKFFYGEDSSFYNTEGSNLICSTLGETIYNINVPAGKIKIGFYSDETLITSENFSNLNSAVLNKLVDANNNGNYSIPIKNISFKGYVNDKQITNLHQNTDVKVVLGVSDIDNIPNKEDISSASGAKYFYYLNSKTQTNSDTIFVTENGTYNYYAYVTFDEIESTPTRIQIVRQDFKGITLGIIIIVIIFVICGAGYFVLKWFKNGAQVAPLSDKEIYRLNKRRGTLEETSTDDYISSLDAPRHETRVSDNKFDDNSLEEDLNTINNYVDDIKPTNDFPEDIDSKE